VQLVPGGRQLLRSHMKVRGLSQMELARLCGDERYRSSIGHLVTGERDGCSEKLAAKLSKVLLGDAAKDSPLFVPRVFSVQRDGRTPIGSETHRRAA